MNRPVKELSKEDLIKLFTSTIFSGDFGNVYLNREIPNVMLCTSINPIEITARAVEGDDTVRKVDSTLDLVAMWDTILPLTEFTSFCINHNAIQRVVAMYTTPDNIRANLLIDPITGLRYTEKVDPSNPKIFKRLPVVWPDICAKRRWDLGMKLDSTVAWVDNCPKTASIPITVKTIAYSGVSKLSLEEHGFAKGIKIPYDNRSGTNLFGYGRKVKLDHLDMHVGQDANIIRYYTKSSDRYATVTCAYPTMYFYSCKVT